MARIPDPSTLPVPEKFRDELWRLPLVPTKSVVIVLELLIVTVLKLDVETATSNSVAYSVPSLRSATPTP
ncbi:hypothetical protein [Shimia sagamensis]|uniref:hypothetical protein n=1 Tax=Shimia sagamensis TaxID=1566352 RepID=UPI0024B803EA|nr:hypothetical protein [Shimia sagamensis]